MDVLVYGEVLVFGFLIVMIFVIWRTISVALNTKSEIKRLKSGELFPDFTADSYIDFFDQILALDRSRRAIVMIKCTYTARHALDDRVDTFSTSVRLDASDVKSIEAESYSEGVPNSFKFLLNSEIPARNSFKKLSISGYAGAIGPFISEIAECLGVSVKIHQSD
jgi:hypothetical protein